MSRRMFDVSQSRSSSGLTEKSEMQRKLNEDGPAMSPKRANISAMGYQRYSEDKNKRHELRSLQSDVLRQHTTGKRIRNNLTTEHKY